MTAQDPSFDDYVALARAGYEAFNRGEIEAVLDLLDPDVSWRRRAVHPVQESYRSRSEVAENVFAAIEEQFADLTFEPLEFVAHAGKIIVRLHQRGRGRSSGIEVEGELVHVLTVAEGRLVALRAYTTMEEAIAAVDSDAA
jgi:ketosteroid isomerase-like protein